MGEPPSSSAGEPTSARASSTSESGALDNTLARSAGDVSSPRGVPVRSPTARQRGKAPAGVMPPAGVAGAPQGVRYVRAKQAWWQTALLVVVGLAIVAVGALIVVQLAVVNPREALVAAMHGTFDADYDELQRQLLLEGIERAAGDWDAARAHARAATRRYNAAEQTIARFAETFGPTAEAQLSYMRHRLDHARGRLTALRETYEAAGQAIAAAAPDDGDGGGAVAP